MSFVHGVNKADESVISSSDEEESLQSITSGDDSGDENKAVRDSGDSRSQQKVALSHSDGRSTCSLRRLLHETETIYPRVNWLVASHLQLCSPRSRDMRWTVVKEMLSRILDHKARRDEKAFHRKNSGRSYPSQHWNSSAQRLLDNFNAIMTELKYDNSTWPPYPFFLPAEESKAFHACMQTWRKLVRRTGWQTTAQTCAESCLSTSQEASILCQQNHQARHVICIDGRLKEAAIEQELRRAAAYFESDQKWSSLEICADSSMHATEALRVALLSFNNYRFILLRQHNTSAHDSILGKTMPLTPLLIGNQAVRSIGTQFPEELGADVFTDADCRQLLRKRQVGQVAAEDHTFSRPPRLASLSTMASLVIRRLDLDVGELPQHLQEAVRTATVCNSCARYMVSRRRSSKTPLSQTTRTQALLAGFKVANHSRDKAWESLAANDHYLPPLCEQFELLESDCRWSSTSINIGGTITTALPEDPCWQFCAFCAALHLGVEPASETQHCLCAMCKLERNKANRTLSVLRWRRRNNGLQYRFREAEVLYKHLL